MVQFSQSYMATGKTITLATWTFAGKVMSLLFNTLPRFAIAFLPRSKDLLFSWLELPSAVILEPNKNFITVSIVFPPICYEVMRQDAMIFIFWKLILNQIFSLSSFTFIKGLFSSSLLSALRVVSSSYLRLLILLAILIPACVSYSPTFCMMFSTYLLNKEGDNI